ncbi:nitrate/nitrite transporter NrtS [Agarivorans sp. Alg241-V36]|uniref:nitrate/nitrite transporter NrtS n=1 Tax=Agarivorans sp. Alg241-V36 TaxID=2305992 RepID=UPI0013D5B171|nr:nitrate/nitrite transporter NrtS [Agarivorans sp. Alg241-V36]
MNKPIFTRALIVAAIVGSVLNLINQWDIINGANPRWGALLFTYCVPLLVSYFSGVMANGNKSTSGNEEGINEQLLSAVLDLEKSLEQVERLPAITRQHLLSIKTLLKTKA